MSEIIVPRHSFVKPRGAKESSLGGKRVEDFQFYFDKGITWADIKSDGNGCFVTVDKKNKHTPIRMWSRKGIEWDPRCFPEMLDDILQMDNGSYHSEIAGYPTYDGFNRNDEKNAIDTRSCTIADNVCSSQVEERPLMLNVFDILRVEDTVLVDRSFSERRGFLESIIPYTNHVQPTELFKFDSAQQMHDAYHQVVLDGFEGLVGKDPNSSYKITKGGCRDSSWIKLKDSSTLDLAVLGVYETDVSRDAGKAMSAVLVGSYNSNTGLYESLSKLSIGDPKVHDQILSSINLIPVEQNVDAILGNDYFVVGEGIRKQPAKKRPDYLVDGLCVVEVDAKNISRNYATGWHGCMRDGVSYYLHGASFVGIRDDKTSPLDVTPSSVVIDLYRD